MKYLKVILLFLLCLITVINSIGQATEFKIFNLKGFGIVTVPTILDTIGQRINKAIIAERINEIQESKIANIIFSTNNITPYCLTHCVVAIVHVKCKYNKCFIRRNSEYKCKCHLIKNYATNISRLPKTIIIIAQLYYLQYDQRK